jgi:hypothetical protein
MIVHGALPGTLRATEHEPVIRISSDEIARVSGEFMGLSYESSQLSHPRFFSADNQELIQFFRTLGDRGVLRLGGNMSEFTKWMPDASLDNIPGETEGPDPGLGSNRVFPVNRQSIDNLAGFLRSTGWKLIYGLNLARGDAASAVDEAKYVVGAIGDRLIALQFGNEPDLFKHGGDKTKMWTYDEFITKWKQFYSAIRTELPHVPIAGPDSSNPKWNLQFCQDVGNKLALQTSHFYPEGPPTDPRMTIDYLLDSGKRLQTFIGDAVELARKNGLPYRMAEGNSCWGAGKDGVSNTFGSALWVADLMLTIAQAGATGVNIHGGANGFYTPIAGSPREGHTARPIYYGMLLAKQFLGGTFLRTEINGSNNISVYAARTHDSLRVCAINRGSDSVSYRVTAPALPRNAEGAVWRLEAPSVSSKIGVTFAKATISSEGVFQPVANEVVRFRESKASLRVAPYSAALVSVPLEKRNA